MIHDTPVPTHSHFMVAFLFAASEMARREALKRAGEAYFNKVLEKAQAGKDPFAQAPARLRRGADVEALDRDPDLEIVGAVLAGVRLYFIGALFVAASAVSFVLIKVVGRAREHVRMGAWCSKQHSQLHVRLCRSRCRHCRRQASRPSCTASQRWQHSGSWSMSRPSQRQC